MTTLKKGQAVVFTAVNQAELKEFSLREPAPGEILVEIAHSCISPGTELRCIAGKEGNAGGFPFVPGYALTGTVIAAGKDVALVSGTKVFCQGCAYAGEFGCSWGGHLSHAIISAAAAVPIPENVSLLDASTAALAAIANHGVELSKPRPGEKVAVVGLGVIGQFSARLHAAAGAEVAGVDLIDSRLEIAADAGIEVINGAGDMKKKVRKCFPDGADIVVDCTGFPPVIEPAMSLAKDIPWDDSLVSGPRFVVQGSYPGDISFPYHLAFNKEMSFLIPRSNKHHDLEKVLEMMSNGKLNVSGIISEVRKPGQAQSAYMDLINRKDELMTIAFDWS